MSFGLQLQYLQSATILLVSFAPNRLPAVEAETSSYRICIEASAHEAKSKRAV